MKSVMHAEMTVACVYSMSGAMEMMEKQNVARSGGCHLQQRRDVAIRSSELWRRKRRSRTTYLRDAVVSLIQNCLAREHVQVLELDSLLEEGWSQ